MAISAGSGASGPDEYGNSVGTVLSEINVTPFVDVMLVLLIIFMVTAPLMTQGVQVNLPRVKAQNLAQREEQPVILTVTKDARCSVLDLEFACDELAAKLPAIYENRTDRSLFVRGDVDTPYGKVLDVLAAGRQAGVLSVGLVTDPAAPPDKKVGKKRP
jgi:biopolymer transport protein TolR